MAHPRSLTEQQRAEVVTAYQSGAETTSEIARRYSVHPDTVRNELRARGLPLRSPGGITGRSRKLSDG